MNSYTIGSKLTIFYVVSTRLLSSSDFLFFFVKLTSLTFPDVFLEHSNRRGMFISEPSFMARVTCIRHYSCCYLKVGNPYILTGIIPVSESVSLSLLEAANNGFSSELSTFFSSSFFFIISCAFSAICSTTDSSGSFVVISNSPSFFNFPATFLCVFYSLFNDRFFQIVRSNLFRCCVRISSPFF